MTELTAERARQFLEYDKETGLIRWKASEERPPKWNTRHAGKVAGSMDGSRITIRFEGKLYLAHRLAWLLETGEWPTDKIDHRNGVPSDNRWENLREATQGQNLLNKAKQSNNTSGYVGVRFREHHGKWEGKINVGGSTVWRKYFDSAQEAAIARRQAIAEFHGEFAIENHNRPKSYLPSK